MYLLRLTSGGRYVWSTAIRGQAPETSRGVAVDAQGGVYTIGQCNGRVDVWPEIPCAAYDGNVIVSYGPDDEYRWSTYLEPAWAEAVVAAPGGRIYVAGDASLRSPIDFGGVRIDGQGLFVAALVPGVVVDSTPPPEPEIEAVRLDGILDGEIRQGGTATMVVAGSHLDEVTSARLGGIDLRLVARSATELHLAVVIPHGHDLGALALVVRNAGGTARIDDAVRVTPVVVAPSGGDTGRGTYASPFALCRDDWSTLVKRTDILRLGGGSHRCRDSVGIPRGVIVEGENRANTIVQFKALRGLETTSGFHGTTEYRALAIEGTESHSILVSTGNVAVTDVDVRDGGGVRVESSGTATLTRYRYRGRQVALLMFRGTVVADGVDVDSDFLGLYMKDGVLRIAESTIQTGGQCAVLAGDPNGAPTQLGRQLTIANSSIRSGACGVKTYGADLVIRDSVVETTDDSAGPTVQVFSGTAWITGSTITGKDPLASGLFMNDWFLVDPRAPTATLEDVVVEAGAGIWYGTHEGSTRLTVRRTRARSAFDTLTVFGPFGAVDLGTPDSPGENELDSETGFPLVDRRSGTGAPIDARGTRLNGTSFTGSVTGPVEVPGTYRIDGPNVLRF